MTFDEELAALVAAEKAGSRARHPAGKRLGGGLVGDAPVKIEHDTGFVIPGPWLDRAQHGPWSEDAVAMVHAGEWRIPAADVTAARRTGWARVRFELADLCDVLRVGLLEPVREWAAARARRWTS